MDDIRELFDYFSEISSAVHKKDAISEAENNLIRAKMELCGNCQKWMTIACKKESLQKTGYKKGPSMNEPACKEFLRSVQSLNLIEERTQELKKLNLE